MRRGLTLFGCQLILWTIIAQFNHSLSDVHVYLFVGGLYVAFGALTQPFMAGLASATAIGAVCDAHAPVAFGTHLMLFAVAHVLLCRLRDRIPRDDTIGRVTVAILANLGVFLILSITRMLRLPVASANWPRLICDLICSQLLVALIAPWFFALQSRALALARADRHD